ncbi:MAG TPA: toast rack family protein [Candidatus Acidoferrales bacterium]|nr:toast rack family protein [Candidatus Acidoferrales bacterium]
MTRRSYAGSITGALILIAIGVVFLIMNLRPQINPWPILFRYWPLILIFIGVGKIFDSFVFRDRSGAPAGDHISGVSVAFVALILIFGLAIWRGHKVEGNELVHDSHSLALLGAKDVSASIEMPAGQLTLTGGASDLLDSNFSYDREEGKPAVDYSVNDGHGQLTITQEGHHIHFGGTRNNWNLHFGENEPLDLTLKIGAGQSDLDFRTLNLKHLEVNIGAGQMNLDLSGPRTANLDADIQGGVGSATIRLPKDVGVIVHASGGIGSTNTAGLIHQDGAYVNAAYGKSAATINLQVHGGIGQIDLLLE